MTPKEKANELYESMFYKLNDYNAICIDIDSKDECAKQCAIIAVEEIKEAIFWHPYESPNFELEYWNEVKQEIEKL